MFQLAKQLTAKGILGLNRRNADYTLAYNPRHLFPLVDDKVQTKHLAFRAGIAVPELYGIVEIQRQIRDLPALLGPHTDFALKPAHGSGGDGILVVAGRRKDRYRKLNGTVMTEEALDHHVSNILSGLYSLGGTPDVALIEYRVQADAVFEPVSYQGVPDIRIIVFLGVPVMAMVRLPTQMSDGKANLHQGAIGAGVDIATGMTLRAVWKNDIIQEHPDTGNAVTGIQIPGWDRLLELAARCYELTRLGYLGVDIVLDRRQGPLMLELNARPGLNIQLANRAGLVPRLELVERHYHQLGELRRRINFAKTQFQRDADRE